MKILADEVKLPTVPSDMVSNEEILHFLQQKVVEKHPQGGAKACRHMVSKALSIDMQTLYVRTTSSLFAKLGYTTVYCDVVLSRDEGKLQIEIKADPSIAEDAIKHVLSYFNVRKRDALVAEVKNWLSLFLQSKLNAAAADDSAAAALSPESAGVGAEVAE